MTDNELEVFRQLLVELIGLKSAYTKHVRHVKNFDQQATLSDKPVVHRGKIDPFYNTRMKDVSRAIEAARPLAYGGKNDKK
jgi:hypothetical protein